MATPEDVIQYLKDNPDFLIEYVSRLGYENEGKKIRSFSEAQLAVEKRKSKRMIKNLQLFISNAKHNEDIINNILKIDLDLMSANTVRQIYLSIKDNFNQLFKISSFALLVHYHGEKKIRIPSQIVLDDENLRQKVSGLNEVYCSNQLLDEKLLDYLQIDAAESFLYMPLSWRDGQVEGLLVATHEDPQYFNDGLQLDYMQHLADIISASLKRTLHIKS